MSVKTKKQKSRVRIVEIQEISNNPAEPEPEIHEVPNPIPQPEQEGPKHDVKNAADVLMEWEAPCSSFFQQTGAMDYKHYLRLKRDEKLAAKQSKAAVRIQAAWRGFIIRYNMKILNKAVTTIQAWARGLVARRKVGQLLQERRERLHQEKLDEAATKIQAAWKGYSSRKNKADFKAYKNIQSKNAELKRSIEIVNKLENALAKGGIIQGSGQKRDSSTQKSTPPPGRTSVGTQKEAPQPNRQSIPPVKKPSPSTIKKQSERKSESQPEKNSENQPDKNAENQPRKNSENQPDKNAENQPRKNSENQPDKNAENQPRKNSENQPDKNAENQPRKNSENQPDKNAENQPRKNSENQPEKNSENQNKPRKNSENQPEKNAENQPRKNSENQPEKKSESQPNKKSETQPEKRSLVTEKEMQRPAEPLPVGKRPSPTQVKRPSPPVKKESKSTSTENPIMRPPGPAPEESAKGNNPKKDSQSVKTTNPKKQSQVAPKKESQQTQTLDELMNEALQDLHGNGTRLSAIRIQELCNVADQSCNTDEKNMDGKTKNSKKSNKMKGKAVSELFPKFPMRDDLIRPEAVKVEALKKAIRVLQSNIDSKEEKELKKYHYLLRTANQPGVYSDIYSHDLTEFEAQLKSLKYWTPPPDPRLLGRKPKNHASGSSQPPRSQPTLPTIEFSRRYGTATQNEYDIECCDSEATTGFNCMSFSICEPEC